MSEKLPSVWRELLEEMIICDIGTQREELAGDIVAEVEAAAAREREEAYATGAEDMRRVLARSKGTT